MPHETFESPRHEIDLSSYSEKELIDPFRYSHRKLAPQEEDHLKREMLSRISDPKKLDALLDELTLSSAGSDGIGRKYPFNVNKEKLEGLRKMIDQELDKRYGIDAKTGAPLGTENKEEDTMYQWWPSSEDLAAADEDERERFMDARRAAMPKGIAQRQKFIKKQGLEPGDERLDGNKRKPARVTLKKHKQPFDDGDHYDPTAVKQKVIKQAHGEEVVESLADSREKESQMSQEDMYAEDETEPSYNLRRDFISGMKEADKDSWLKPWRDGNLEGPLSWKAATEDSMQEPQAETDSFDASDEDYMKGTKMSKTGDPEEFDLYRTIGKRGLEPEMRARKGRRVPQGEITTLV